MVTIDVPVYPDRAASIRAGLDPSTTSIAVDLDVITQEERDLLADHDGSPVDVTTPTIAALFEALQVRAERDRARLDEVLQAFRTALRERRTKTWDREIKPGGLTCLVTEPRWPSWRAVGGGEWERVMVRHLGEVRAITEGEEAQEWIQELENLNRTAHTEAVEAQRAAEEAEERRSQEATERLRDWALAYGSERVRLLIEENYPSWNEIAENEFFSAHTPDGFIPLTDDDYVRSLPEPEAADIQALRKARVIAAAEEAAGEPELIWVGRILGPGRVPGQSGIRLTLTGPHGAQRTIWRPVTEQPAPVDASAEHDEPARPTLADAIDDLRGLIDGFDDMRTDQMTNVFYVQGYSQLLEAGRTILEVLDAQAADW